MKFEIVQFNSVSDLLQIYNKSEIKTNMEAIY